MLQQVCLLAGLIYLERLALLAWGIVETILVCMVQRSHPYRMFHESCRYQT